MAKLIITQDANKKYPRPFSIFVNNTLAGQLTSTEPTVEVDLEAGSYVVQVRNGFGMFGGKSDVLTVFLTEQDEVTLQATPNTLISLSLPFAFIVSYLMLRIFIGAPIVIAAIAAVGVVITVLAIMPTMMLTKK